MGSYGVLRHFLHPDIQSECDIASGHRLLLPFLGDNLAAVAGDHLSVSTGTVKIFLKGQLRPLQSHYRIIGITQSLILLPHLVRCVLPRPPQHVGGVRGVVLTGGFRFKGYAIQAEFLHFCNKGDVHILGKHVLAVCDLAAAQTQFIKHSQQVPDLRGNLGILLVQLNPVGAAHLHHQRLGVQIGHRVLLRLIIQRVIHPLIGHRQRPQISAPLLLADRVALIVLFGIKIGVYIRLCKRIGCAVCHREGIRPFHPFLPAQRQQLRQYLVARVSHQGGIQRYLIGGLIGHQHPAVAVQNISADSVHRLCLHRGVGRRDCLIVRSVDHLNIIQHPAINA